MTGGDSIRPPVPVDEIVANTGRTRIEGAHAHGDARGGEKGFRREFTGGDMRPQFLGDPEGNHGDERFGVRPGKRHRAVSGITLHEKVFQRFRTHRREVNREREQVCGVVTERIACGEYSCDRAFSSGRVVNDLEARDNPRRADR